MAIWQLATNDNGQKREKMFTIEIGDIRQTTM